MKSLMCFQTFYSITNREMKTSGVQVPKYYRNNMNQNDLYRKGQNG